MPLKNFFSILTDKKIGSEKYIFVSLKKSWNDAQSYCRQQYTDLASVRDDAEWLSIKSRILSQDLWFGLFRDSWKWIDQANVYSIPWKSGQPDNNKDNEDCGCLLNNQAEDKLCSEKMSFFCYSGAVKQYSVPYLVYF